MIKHSILPKKVIDPVQLSLGLAGIAVRSQRLMIDFLTRRPDLGGLSDPAGIGQAFLDLTAKMIADPMSIAQMQLDLWCKHVKLLQRTTERLTGITNKSDHRPVAADRRFRHSAWTENFLFDYIKQSYLLSAEAILAAVNRVDGLNPKAAHKVDFYTRQFVDAMAPSFDAADQVVIAEYSSPLMPAAQRHEGNDLAAENVRAHHFEGAIGVDRLDHFEDMLRAGRADGDDHDAARP